MCARSLPRKFSRRGIGYGESAYIQTLNLSYYPDERGPTTSTTLNIADDGSLLNPEKRWGGIMRRLDNTNFEQQQHRVCAVLAPQPLPRPG